MIKVIVAGAAGRMGGRLVSLLKDSAALTLTGAVESKGHISIGEDAGEIAGCGQTGVLIRDDLSAVMDRGEVVIDFSTPAATLDHLRIASQHRRAMVIGTTGFASRELEEFRALAKQIPCVFSPNMSVGVNVIFKVIDRKSTRLNSSHVSISYAV